MATGWSSSEFELGMLASIFPSTDVRGSFIMKDKLDVANTSRLVREIDSLVVK